MEWDSLGRRRREDQGRGLRPLHPVLPEEWASRAVRVAMSEADWARLDSLARAAAAESPTMARAYGLAIARLLREAEGPVDGPADWMDWERQKALRLLRRPAS